jgi:hypothetical protein
MPKICKATTQTKVVKKPIKISTSGLIDKSINADSKKIIGASKFGRLRFGTNKFV